MKKLKTLSRSTRSLLQAGEGQHLDYKEKPNGLKAEDLVAFANGGGGTLLLGVREISGTDGAQAGTPVGCPVDDHTLLAIQNKASECQPPISIHIQIENTNSAPIIRIDIPDSRFKPHGTSSGLYKIRHGSANRGLVQHELLSMFLSREGDAFISRFKSAVSDTERTLKDIEGMVSEMSAELETEIGQLKESMIDAMKQIKESASDHGKSNKTPKG